MNPKPPQSTAHVIAVGSLNVDRIWHVPAFPSAGETVIASNPREELGGKGANQAVAAARQGAQVTLIGAVGNDGGAALYREHLEKEGISSSYLRTTAKAATGSAHVYLTPDGENMIVVEPGANQHLDAHSVEGALRSLGNISCVLLTQLECPAQTINHTLQTAHALGIRSLLNASPVSDHFQWGLCPIDTVIVNEHECSHWFGQTPAQLWDAPAAERQALLQRFAISHLIITRGKEATFYLSANTQLSVPCLRVQPVDTVGAGDTFAGALAVQIAEGADWESAISHANAAAALATLGFGAQTAMPTRQKVLRHLQNNEANERTSAVAHTQHS